MLANLFQKKRKTGTGPFIQMQDITKIFKTPAGEFIALKNVNADFEKGEFVSVVGKSGSGKSTLVNMLTGIDHPTSGKVKIGDTYVHKLNESRMARWRGRNLGIVFQFYQLLPMLSLLENVMLPMDFCDMYAPSEREKHAVELLDMVGLSDVADKMPAAVSGGQQQSAAIARALANDPPLIVADEPTGNLDSRSAETVFHVFEELARDGKTIIMVTHDNNLAQRASRTMLLSDGEVIDETVASTLSLLTHQQMLKATKSLQTKTFEPGETIIRQGEHNDHFYMIAQGVAEVHIERGNRLDVIANLGPRQFFGEIELLEMSARAVASIKAALHAPLQVGMLNRTIFRELMNEAHEMREAITAIVHQRLAQNVAFLREKRERGYAATALA
jgi:ABC-type lipoprotein export system ATPase subunit